MIIFENATVTIDGRKSLEQLNWEIESGDCWAIVGPNGSGKALLLESLSNNGKILTGVGKNLAKRIGIVSLHEQERLIVREAERDDSDLTDQIFSGTSVQELLDESSLDLKLQRDLTKSLRLDSLLYKGFRKLSTGESKKVLLAKALLGYPDLLLLEDPLEGFDQNSSAEVTALLEKNSLSTTQIYSVSRIKDIPSWTNNVICLDSHRVIRKFSCNNGEDAKRFLSSITRMGSKQVALPVPPEKRPIRLNKDNSLVNIKNGKVGYLGHTVFEDLDLVINPGSHWQITGPNGSGKTTLLNLITGDHPQSYVNDISIFGYSKGGGETIWDIKRHLGFISNALHWQHRLTASARNVIISGFFDSIGLYAKPSGHHVRIADAWLNLIGMEKQRNARFSELSFGYQRLLLICRAMVKHPSLLLLDEPCRGLDEANRELVLALVSRLCTDGNTTIVYVSHELEDIVPQITNHLDLGDLE